MLWRKICEKEGIPLSRTTPGLIPGEPKPTSTTVKHVSTKFAQCNIISSRNLSEHSLDAGLTLKLFPESASLAMILDELLFFSTTDIIKIDTQLVQLQ